MFTKLAEGDIFATLQPDIRCAGSRTAVLPDGSLICVWHECSGVGVNDFVPVAAYSKDGLQWSAPKPIWPELIGVQSLCMTVRPTADGRICLAGMSFRIDAPGEAWWSDELGAMKENQLAYAISEDGYAFPQPTCVDLPEYGAAEQPGGMLVDADGTMTMVYSPYPTIERRGETDTCCLMYVRSTDGGKTWQHAKVGCVPPPSLYAEAWIVRLSDGRLMTATWQTASEDAPDQYFLSEDDGASFQGPFTMSFRGQTTALLPWKDGSVFVTYNQRKQAPAGVWLALARPDASGFNLIANEPVWTADVTTRSNSSGDFAEWTDYAFGEPQVTVLPDGTLLVCLWYEKGEKRGIRYVHLKITD